jgi:peptide/nickel transport system substrate-binding protein
MRTKSRALGRPLVICMLVGAMMVLVAACGGSSKGSGKGSTSGATTTSSSANNANTAASKYGTVLFGKLPAAGTPASGGTVSVSQQTGEGPTYIFPIIPGANTSTGTLNMVSNIYMPLYAGPTGAEPKVDYGQSFAASAPAPSNGDKTYTIHLKPGLKSNGAPMDANDVLFWYYLLRAAVKASAANWGQYVPGQFPMSVTSASAPNKDTVVFHLNKAYNPGYVLNNQLADTDNTYPLPSTSWNLTAAGTHTSNWKNPAVALKIYNYLNKQGAAVAGFASNPLWKVVSGPFKLQSFTPANSSFVLVPNPSYGGSPKAKATIDVNTYTSVTSAYNALQSGSLDIDFLLDPSQLNQVKSLTSQGIDTFGGPSWGWFGGQINFLDTTDHFNKVIAQPYARQALDHLVNQPAIIKGVYKSAAVTAYGPTPSAPSSPYAPADATKAPYPYDPSTAVSLLKSHGWKVVPNGQTTCIKPGSGSGECGAGIPKGTPFKFVWANVPMATSTTGPLESEALASIAKQAAGINIDLVTKSFNFLAEYYNDANPAAVKNKDAWGVNNYGGLFEDYYPTQAGVENNPGTGFNIGSYNSKTADHLINNSVFGGNANAVKTEAAFLEKDVPVIYFPDQDSLSAVNTKKVGSSPNGFLALTQQAVQPQYWYAVK